MNKRTIDKDRILNSIYDTIMENVSLSEYHKSFLDLYDTKLKSQYIGADNIYLQFEDEKYIVTVKKMK